MRAGSGVALPASVKIMKKEGGCGSLLLIMSGCALCCDMSACYSELPKTNLLSFITSGTLATADRTCTAYRFTLA